MNANEMVENIENIPVLNFLTGIWKGFTGQASSEKMNQQNIDFQNAFNQQVFDREDTYLQRRVEDAQKAGFSPLAALSGASNYSSVASAPQNSFAPPSMSGIQGVSLIGDLIANLRNAGSNRLSAEADSSNASTNKSALQIQKEWNDTKKQLEYDKLSQADLHFLKSIDNAVELAEIAKSGQMSVAEINKSAQKYHDDMLLELKRKDRLMQDNQLSHDLAEKKEAYNRALEKMEKEQEFAMKEAKKARNQAERQFWLKMFSDTARQAGQLAVQLYLGGAFAPASAPIGF